MNFEFLAINKLQWNRGSPGITISKFAHDCFVFCCSEPVLAFWISLFYSLLSQFLSHCVCVFMVIGSALRWDLIEINLVIIFIHEIIQYFIMPISYFSEIRLRKWRGLPQLVFSILVFHVVITSTIFLAISVHLDYHPQHQI